MAHGQAMMSTAIMLTIAYVPRGSGPRRYHARNVRAATAITEGTKYDAITSASRPMGGLLPWASLTISTIRDRTVSFPTRVAVNTSRPFRFIVPPVTALPGVFSAGIGSPVSIDSSTADRPSSTAPSTGILSPGRTTTRSPTVTDSIGTSTSPPPRSTRAVFGASPISFFTASEVRPFALASKNRPSSTRTMIAADVS
jgi:hypothetical protein